MLRYVADGLRTAWRAGRLLYEINDGFQQMKRHGVLECVIELEPYRRTEDPMRPSWMSAAPYIYFPEELTPAELELIAERRPYLRTAMILEQGGRERIPAIEAARIFPEVGYYFKTGRKYMTDESMGKFAELTALLGWRPDVLQQRIRAGMIEWHAIVRRLQESMDAVPGFRVV